MDQATASVRQQGTEGTRPVAELPAFDLSRILARIRKEHPDWPEERILRAEEDYRRFLACAKADRYAKLSPFGDVDTVWHTHIVYTRQYHADCDAYFGYYLHHEPFDETNRDFARRSALVRPE